MTIQRYSMFFTCRVPEKSVVPRCRRIPYAIFEVYEIGGYGFLSFAGLSSLIMGKEKCQGAGANAWWRLPHDNGGITTNRMLIMM